MYLQMRSLFAPVYLRGTPTIKKAPEALRSHSRLSQRVSEAYSPLILRMVRDLCPLHLPGITMSSWLVMRVNIG